MANLVTLYDTEDVLIHGCWHKNRPPISREEYPYPFHGICEACSRDVLHFYSRRIHELTYPVTQTVVEVSTDSAAETVLPHPGSSPVG